MDAIVIDCARSCQGEQGDTETSTPGPGRANCWAHFHDAFFRRVDSRRVPRALGPRC